MNQEIAQQRKLLETQKAEEKQNESDAKNDKKGLFSKKNKKWTFIFMTSIFHCTFCLIFLQIFLWLSNKEITFFVSTRLCFIT